MNDASETFESALFMCNWAKRAVEEFEVRAKAFTQANRYVLFVDFDPKALKHEVKIKFPEPIPPELRGYASDAIKNIRDALDQAMAAASRLITRKKSKRTHFPFGESDDDLEDSLSRKKARHCRDIPEELYPIIRRFEPYPTDRDMALKALNLVSGDHKHGVTLTLGASTNQVTLGRNVFPKGGGLYIPPRGHPEREELAIAWFPKGGQANLNLNFPVFIALNHPLLWDHPAAFTIRYWVERVTAMVGGLEAEARRIVDERAIH